MKKTITFIALVAAIILIWLSLSKFVMREDVILVPVSSVTDGQTGPVSANPATTTIVQAAGGQVYANTVFSFSAFVPEGFSINESYFNYTLGPGKEIPGISFTIPVGMATGTNLSADTRMSVEVLSRAACVPADFIPTTSKGTPITVGANSYKYASSADAGAGNRYDESIYVTKLRETCYGVRFFIHSTAIENYEPGTRKAFDREAVTAKFKEIMGSLKFI
jgi:hypothetical protein